MDQMLLLVSVLIALFLMSTKQGQKVAKDVSKSVSSITSQKGKGGFPSGIVLVLVLFALLCLSRKRLVEGLVLETNTTVQDLCDFINPPSTDSSMNAVSTQYGQSHNSGWGACPTFPSPSKSFCLATPGNSEHINGWDAWKMNYTVQMGAAWPTANGCPTYPPPTRGIDALQACR